MKYFILFLFFANNHAHKTIDFHRDSFKPFSAQGYSNFTKLEKNKIFANFGSTITFDAKYFYDSTYCELYSQSYLHIKLPSIKPRYNFLRMESYKPLRF